MYPNRYAVRLNQATRGAPAMAIRLVSYSIDGLWPEPYNCRSPRVSRTGKCFMNVRRFSVVASLGGVLLFPGIGYAEKKTQASSEPRETVAKPLTDKERKKKEDKLRKELEGPYR